MTGAVILITASFLIMGAWGVALYVGFLRHRLRRMSVKRSWHAPVVRCLHGGRARKIDYVGYPPVIQCLECGKWSSIDNAVANGEAWSNAHPYGLVGMLLDTANPFRLYNDYEDADELPEFGDKP